MFNVTGEYELYFKIFKRVKLFNNVILVYSMGFMKTGGSKFVFLFKMEAGSEATVFTPKQFLNGNVNVFGRMPFS